eukprot:COSAG02_NODE_106_length_36326_cov_13.777266_12_plen_84_part_00
MPVVKNEWGRVGFRHMGQCYHTSLHFRSFPSAGIDLRLWTGTVAMMNRSGWLLLHSVSAHDLASMYHAWATNYTGADWRVWSP